MSLCQCGCGNQAPLARQTDTKRGYMRGQPVRFLPGHNHMQGPRNPKAYRMLHLPQHPHASPSGCIAEHTVIVERAIGKILRRTADVHHVDGNSQNNAHRNLVVCQDRAYHKFLHVRTRIVKAGGDPNTDHLCSLCQQLKPRAAFHRSTQRQIGLQNACIACRIERDKGRPHRREKATA